MGFCRPVVRYFQIGIRVEPAWRGCCTLGSGYNRTDKYAFFSYVYYVSRCLGPRPCTESSASCIMSIDRIAVTGGYCPGNIRWAWISLQAVNKWEQVRTHSKADHARKQTVTRTRSFDSDNSAANTDRGPHNGNGAVTKVSRRSMKRGNTH